jgi:Xaa-Pro aminopeptidase
MTASRPTGFRVLSLVALVALLTSALPAAQLFDKSEYAARRQKFYEKIPNGTAVIFGAQPIASYYPYGQSNDFLYLTGVELSNAAIILDGARKSATLFFTSTEDAALGEGIPADLVKNPQAFTGIERIMPIEALTQQIAMLAQRSTVLYTPFRPEELFREASMEKARTLLQNQSLNIWDGRTTREMQFVKVLRDQGLLPAYLGAPDNQIAGRDRASPEGRPHRGQGPHRDHAGLPSGNDGARAFGRLQLRL